MNHEIMFRKRDLLASLIIGLMVAVLFSIAILIKDLQGRIPFWWSLVLIIPILCAAGLYVSFLLGRKIRIIYQFAKFVLVGGLNTLIDFGVFNLLMLLSGIYKGEFIVGLNAISFLVAVTNSYLWNKFWTFKEDQEAQVEKESVAKEFIQFIVVTLIGLSINSGVVYLATTFVDPMFGFSAVLWANLAKAAATVASLLWNFIGYKLIVFKS